MNEGSVSRNARTARSIRGVVLAVIVFAVVLGMTMLLPKKAFAFDVPAARGAVTDVTNTLTFNEDADLEKMIAAYRTRTTNEIGVLMIDSLGGETVESVALQTFNTWGIGKKEKNNGVLILIAKKEHRTRIETGNGVRNRLNDKACARILEMVAVHLRDGRFADGVEGAVLAVEAELDRSTSDLARPTPPTTAPTTVPPYVPPPPAPRSIPTATEPRSAWPSVLLIMCGGLLVFVLCRIWLRRDGRWHGYRDSSTSYTDHSLWSSSSSWNHGHSSSHTDFGGSSSSSSSSSFDSGGGGSSFSGGSSDGGGSSGSY